MYVNVNCWKYQHDSMQYPKLKMDKNNPFLGLEEETYHINPCKYAQKLLLHAQKWLIATPSFWLKTAKPVIFYLLQSLLGWIDEYIISYITIYLICPIGFCHQRKNEGLSFSFSHGSLQRVIYALIFTWHE